MTAALEGGEWSSAARPGCTLPPWKTRYPFYRRLGGPQGRSGRAENLVPTGIRSRTVQPVVSRYTDWATGPTIICYNILYGVLFHYTQLLLNFVKSDLTFRSTWMYIIWTKRKKETNKQKSGCVAHSTKFHRISSSNIWYWTWKRRHKRLSKCASILLQFVTKHK